MKEFGNPIPLTRGLTPFSRTPLNAPFLEDMTGLIPRPLLAEGPPALSYPVTDPYAATSTWPHPQYMRGERGKYVGLSCAFMVESGGTLSLDHSIEFDAMHNSVFTVGEPGTGDGQFNCPKDAGSWISSGKYYYTAITDSLNNRVQILKNFVYYAKFGSSGSAAGQFSSPCGLDVIAVSGTKRIFVVDTGNHRVQRFALDGTYEATWGTFGTGNGQFSSPTYICVYNNEIYVSDTGNNRVQVFDLSGVYQREWTVTNPLGICPGQVAGEIFVVSGSADRVNIYDTTGVLLRYFSDQLVAPHAIAFYNGLWYVSDSGLVRAYTKNGKYRFNREFSAPMGLHSGADGRLWIMRESSDYMSLYFKNPISGGVWHLATFQDAYYVTNGATFYFHHGQDDADIGMSVTTTVEALCAHDGRLLLGGLGGPWFDSARWTTVMEVWRETLPVDVRANVNLTWGNHWVVWGARGGGASDYPDYLLMAAIGCYGEGGFDEVEELIWTAIENGEIGLCPVRNVSTIRAMKPLGARVIVYGDGGISELTVASIPRYWEHAVVDYGVPGRGCVGGWDNEHVFVDCQGHLYRFPVNALTPKLLDYSWLLSDMDLDGIVISHDTVEDCYWIADGTDCYVLTRQGLGGPVDTIPTGVFRDATNGLVGYAYEVASPGTVRIVTCPMDLGDRGSKQASAVQIQSEGVEALTAEMQWRMKASDSFSRGRAAQANHNGAAFPRQSFVEGKLEISGTVIVDTSGTPPVSTSRFPAIHGIELRYQAEDRRFVRGTKAIQGNVVDAEAADAG